MHEPSLALCVRFFRPVVFVAQNAARTVYANKMDTFIARIVILTSGKVVCSASAITSGLNVCCVFFFSAQSSNSLQVLKSSELSRSHTILRTSTSYKSPAPQKTPADHQTPAAHSPAVHGHPGHQGAAVLQTSSGDHIPEVHQPYHDGPQVMHEEVDPQNPESLVPVSVHTFKPGDYVDSLFESNWYPGTVMSLIPEGYVHCLLLQISMLVTASLVAC